MNFSDILLFCLEYYIVQSDSKYLFTLVFTSVSDEAMETVNIALEFKDKGVVGIDLSGNPHVIDI